MAVHIQTTSLDGALAAFREGEVKLLTEIATALAEFKEADEDRRRLLDIAQDLREMFFLVVVIGMFGIGEVLTTREEPEKLASAAAYRLDMRVVLQTWAKLPRTSG